MIVDKGHLCAALDRLKYVITPKTALPALQCIKLEAVGGAVTLAATDLTTWVRTSVPSDGSLRACIPVKPFLDAVKLAGHAGHNVPVELTARGPREVMVVGPGARTVIAALPFEDHPHYPGTIADPSAWQEDATWDAATLRDALAWVLPAASADMTRPHLTAVYFDNEAVVTTDGHRLHLTRLEGLNAGPTALPARAIGALCRILRDAGRVAAHRAEKGFIRFTAGAWELTTTIMTERFPPYEMVIPPASFESFHAVVEVARLTEALKRLPRARAGRNVAVKLRVNGQIFLERDTGEGSSSAGVPLVQSTHTGADFEMGVDGRYLLDALAVDDEVVTSRFGGPLDPIRVEIGADAHKLAILMPMHL
jgi:DNA polymerase III subunit beta